MTIKLNGKTFTRGKAAMIETLFEPGNTASGFYRVRNGAVMFFDPQGAPIAVINRAGVFGSATRLDSGRIWYSFATPRIIGEWESYKDGVEQVKQAHAMALAN